MAGVQDFVNGANILQQVDVSEIFKSLAMGIADAQQALDDNSISQLQRLSETELAGKSLLELGFVPAFYSFTYADVSASINLKMAEKTSFELGAEASFDYSSGSGSSSDFSDLSKESQFQSEQGEYKSNRAFSIKSSSKKKIKVNNQYYQFDQNEKIVSRIEKLHSELLLDEQIDRVNIQYSQAYTTVFENKSNYSILVITDITAGNDVDVSTNTVTILGQSFSTIFDNSYFTVSRFGFFGYQVYVNASATLYDLDFFFDTGKWALDFSYDLALKGISQREFILEGLATVLKNDPSLSITISGYTDTVGSDTSNQNLSNDRCESMRKWLVAKGANITQIDINPLGEKPALIENGNDVNDPNFRKVRITLSANRYYIIFSTEVGGTSPEFDSGMANYFINVGSAASPTFVIINGNASGFIATGATIGSFESANATATDSLFQSETREAIHYFLNKQTEVTYMAYSADSETIEIAAEEGSESEIKVYKNENSKERIKNLASKNNSNKTFAASASIDFRMSRQFEMSIEGSASMSARLVAVPPPDEFKLHIATVFNGQ